MASGHSVTRFATVALPTLALALGLAAVVRAAGPDRAALLTEAGKTAQRIADPNSRALALMEVGVATWPTDQVKARAEFSDAAQAANLLEEPLAQIMTERGLAARQVAVDPAPARRTLDALVIRSGQLKFLGEKSLALREVARVFIPVDRAQAAKVFAQAKDAAERIDANVFRCAALRELALAALPVAPQLSSQCLDAAETALKGVPNDPGLPMAQAELAAALAQVSPERGYRLANAIKQDEVRRAAAVQIAEALAERSPDLALAAVQAVKDPQAQTLALAAAAAHVGVERGEVAAMLAEQALTRLAPLSPDDRERVGGWCAEALAATDAARAAELAGKIKDPELRDETLAHVACLQAVADPRGAMKVADRIDDISQREGAIARLVPLLAKVDPQAAVDRAHSILARRAQVTALLAIVAALTPPSGSVTPPAAQPAPAPTGEPPKPPAGGAQPPKPPVKPPAPEQPVTDRPKN